MTQYYSSVNKIQRCYNDAIVFPTTRGSGGRVVRALTPAAPRSSLCGVVGSSPLFIGVLERSDYYGHFVPIVFESHHRSVTRPSPPLAVSVTVILLYVLWRMNEMNSIKGKYGHKLTGTSTRPKISIIIIISHNYLKFDNKFIYVNIWLLYIFQYIFSLKIVK